MARESREAREARELREAYETLYGDQTVSELETTVIGLLDEVDDLQGQRKAHMDTMKETIDNRVDAIKYCRERRHYLRGLNLEDQATAILREAE